MIIEPSNNFTPSLVFEPNIFDLAQLQEYTQVEPTNANFPFSSSDDDSSIPPSQPINLSSATIQSILANNPSKQVQCSPLL
jgi:hypothetical protein